MKASEADGKNNFLNNIFFTFNRNNIQKSNDKLHVRNHTDII